MGKRILIVDDDAAISELLRMHFQEAGFDVATACHGRAALQHLETDAFDLVVTDIFMPEQDGLEFIQAARARHPGVEIIAISGGGRGFDPNTFLKIARSLGAKKSFLKPFDCKELVQEAEALLAKPNRAQA